MSHQRLGPGIEFDRVRAVAAALAGAARGLGDDCGVVESGGGTLVASTDASVEGVHFRRDWLALDEIGWRAAAAALSDLAAMGAQARGVLVALVLPPSIGESDTATIMRGVGDAATEAGAPVVGGDLSRGEQLVLAVTVLGVAARPVRRDGAQPGDGLWVTGALGGARAALSAWQHAETPGAEARVRFARPVPRLAAGAWLARHGATAMIDLSDGLAGDARHVATASGVALDIDAALLPLAPGVAEGAVHDGITPAEFGALGGEDYELLVALPAAFGAADAARCLAETGTPLTRVGAVRAGEGVHLALGDEELPPGGFDHFRPSPASR